MSRALWNVPRPIDPSGRARYRVSVSGPDAWLVTPLVSGERTEAALCRTVPDGG
ncbi:MAG: hypothetical protein WEG36_06210 [Gemmatimonadota bacterium]